MSMEEIKKFFELLSKLDVEKQQQFLYIIQGAAIVAAENSSP